jgi:hypothetical protein
MRRILAAWAMAAGVASAGCWQVSIHPFFDETAPLDGVAGPWVADEKDPGTLELVASPDGSWTIRLTESDGDTSAARVRFGRVGDQLFWDMTAEVPKGAGELTELHLLPVHSVARVRLEGDRLEVAQLDPRWLAQAIDDGRVELAHADPDSRDSDAPVILTAPTAELEGFLRSYGDDPEAFSETTVYHRAREVPSPSEGDDRD